LNSSLTFEIVFVLSKRMKLDLAQALYGKAQNAFLKKFIGSKQFGTKTT
jgi:hypothetical protein